MVGSDWFDGFDVSDPGFFENVMNFIDIPMENIDLDGGDCDALSQLSLPGVADDIGNVTFDGLPSLCLPNPLLQSDEIFKPKELPSFVKETSGANMTLQNDSSDGLNLGMFQASSPVSVLESSSSCSVEKNIPVGSKTSIPVRRSKRSRTSSFKLQPEMSNSVKRKPKKKKKLSQLLGAPPTKKNSSASPLSGGTAMKGKCVQHSVETKKCTHCEVTKTPQWREGPMGPRTLCNACGVRYKSGRLFPEYRPASSPTFDPSLHSNSHKKVIEKRNMANQEAEAAMTETDSAMSPPPEFVPMSSYLFD